MRKRDPRSSALRLIAAPWCAAKLISLLAAVLTVWTTRDNPGFPTWDEIGSHLNQWDSQSYVKIATLGYPATTTDPHTVYLDGFFPGYPMLVRLGGYFTGDLVMAGLLLSALFEGVALYYIARLVIAERDAGSARFVVWLFALWPFAFFLTGVYTESTFLAAAAASLYYARQGDTPRATLSAVLACSVRVTGIALVPALAWELYSRRRATPSNRRQTLPLQARDWALIGVIPAPMLAYCVYQQVHAHDFFAYLTAQSSASFNHHLAPPWVGFWRTFGQVRGNPSYTFTFEVIFGALGAVLCVALWLHPKFPRTLAIYCTGVFLVATSLDIWLSVPRYELAMFPALLFISDITRRRLELRAAIIGVSSALMGLGTALFTSGRWLG